MRYILGRRYTTFNTLSRRSSTTTNLPNEDEEDFEANINLVFNFLRVLPSS